MQGNSRTRWAGLFVGHGIFCSSLMLGFLAVRPASAQPTNALAQPMPLSQCIQMALEHNLDIQIERYAPEIARYNLDMGYSAYEPVFSAGGTHSHEQLPGGINQQNQSYSGTTSDSDAFNAGFTGSLPFGSIYSLAGNMTDTTVASSGTPFGNASGTASVQLTQPLLKNFWIDSPRMTILVNRKLLRISELALRQQIMATVTAVETAYYDLSSARANVGVQQEALQLAEKLVSEDQQRIAAGALPRLDEKQAESQLAARRSDLLVAEQLLGEQKNVLKLLLVEDTATWRSVNPEPAELPPATAQELNLGESWQKAFNLRPDLLQSRADLERQGIVLKYLRNQIFPELDVVGSYGRNASATQNSGAFNELRTGDSPYYSYGAQVTFPLGNGNARNNYKSDKATKQQSLLRLKQLELQIMSQVENSVRLAQVNFQRVEATRQSRLFAETALEAEQKKMEGGKSTSFFVLQFQRDLTAARSAEVQALADYNKALAQLAFNEGTTLERNKLDMVIK